MIYYQVAFPDFGCSLGAIEMKQGGHNGHSGQFLPFFVHCVDTMEVRLP